MLVQPMLRCFHSLVLFISLFACLSNSSCQEPSSKEPGTEGNGNFVIGPDYSIHPDLTDRGNPKGKSFEFSMRLADSKVFPGNDATLDFAGAVRVDGISPQRRRPNVGALNKSTQAENSCSY